MRPPALSPARLVRRQVVLEDHVPLPDGRGAIVVERRVEANAYRSHLLLVPFVPGAKLRALTGGAVRDTTPQVSPDGRRVAFVRTIPADPDAPTRLMLADLEGGEPEVLWEAPRGIAELAWSPDGGSLAIVAPADPARFIVGAATGKQSPTARRITRIDWRWDEIGHRDRWDQVWVVPARPGGRPRQVTRGEADAKGLAWSPDGEWIAFAADPRPDADLHPRPSIWVVGRRGDRAPREALALAGYAGSPAFSPDGRWLACVGVDVASPFDDEQPGVFVAPFDPRADDPPTAAAAGAPPRPAIALGPGLDLPVGAWLDTDLNGWMVAARSGPMWDGNEALVALVSEAGRSLPWRFELGADGRPAAAPRKLVTADVAAWSIGLASTAGRATLTILGTLGDRPMELMTVSEPGTPRARLRTWTRSGSAWRRGLPWPRMERLLVPGAGGQIETWIASPAGAGTAPLPTVVDVHGGPLGAWSPAPSLEVILLCAHGFRVVLPNVRGSAGYGRAWIAPQLGDWGGVDASDVLAAVEHVVERGLADASRLGILGLSYGGFMVNWLVGAAPGRFAAAVSENGVTNQVSDWANCDSGPEYDRAGRLGDTLSPDGVERLWRQSPLRGVTAIRTPLLMLQAEEDLRCPPQGNEQLFIALRMLGRTVEYVLYPESHHTYAITGRPDRRIDRHERMLAWFERFLPA